MCLNDLEKDMYYTISELSKVLKVSPQTVFTKVSKREIIPDFIHPVTGKKYFLKEKIEEQYLKAIAS